MLYYASGIFQNPFYHFSQDFSFNLDLDLNPERAKNNLEVQVGLLAFQLHFVSRSTSDVSKQSLVG